MWLHRPLDSLIARGRRKSPMKVRDTLGIVHHSNDIEAVPFLATVEGPSCLSWTGWSSLKVDMTPINESETVRDAVDGFDSCFEVESLVNGWPMDVGVEMASYSLYGAICPSLDSPFC